MTYNLSVRTSTLLGYDSEDIILERPSTSACSVLVEHVFGSVAHDGFLAYCDDDGALVQSPSLAYLRLDVIGERFYLASDLPAVVLGPDSRMLLGHLVDEDTWSKLIVRSILPLSEFYS